MNTADYNGRKLVLCEDQTPGFSTRITAEVKDGCFIITGKDEGAAVQAFIGVPGYEYFYILGPSLSSSFSSYLVHNFTHSC